MSSLPKSINLIEVGPREGFQFEGIGDPGKISTDSKVRLVDALSGTGIQTIQVISFVHPKAVPQVADAEEVAKRFKRKPGVKYTAVYLNDKGLERAWNTGKLDFEGHFYLAASETFSKRNTKRTLEEEVTAQRRMIEAHREKGIPIEFAGVTAAFGCNFEGDISLNTLIDRIKVIFELDREYDLNLQKLQLADTMGWANPEQIKRTIGEIKDIWPNLDIGLHLHDTRGTGMANVFAALEMGVTNFDSAVAGLGGCPFAGHRAAAGNVCTEDIVFMCEEMGISTAVNLDTLIECAQLAEDIVGHPLPGKVMKGGSLDKYRIKEKSQGR
jgi:hydroxymethylglutaryl-CoA lyase